MIVDSTVEITKYESLKDGDIFTGVNQNGGRFLGMKVATRSDPSDQPNHDILLLSSEKPPVLYPSGYLGDMRVAKMKDLAFVVHPQTVTDFLFDLHDTRVRAAIGCAFLVGNDIFLAVETKNVGYAGVFFVNVKTGEGWSGYAIGSLTINPSREGVAVASWQIAETTNDKTPWINYKVLREEPAMAA